MSIDDRTRKELEQQGTPVEHLKADETALFPMLFGVFSGAMARWAGFALALTLVFFGLTLWSGYSFFTATTTDGRIFWGVVALAAVQSLSMLKLWFFMEMNRQSITRDVKRLEVALARLQ